MSGNSKVKNVDPDCPQTELILKAAQIIQKGGVIIFPTRGLYGLAADATRPETVARIFEIKRRPFNKPLPILISDRRQVDDWTREISASALKIIDTFWPGRITLVFRSNRLLPAAIYAQSDKIGIRQPGHPVAMALVRSVAGPITGTSANLSGAPGCHRVSDLPDSLLGQVDLILDAGPLAGGAGSTVVDVSTGKVVILREGAVSKAEIERAFK